MNQYDIIRAKIQDFADKGKASGHAYLIGWNGHKTPVGATIDGNPIVAARHGLVTCEGIKGYAATYERMCEFAGPNNDRHLMLIVTSKPAVVIPPGGEKVDRFNPEESINIERMISLEDDE